MPGLGRGRESVATGGGLCQRRLSAGVGSARREVGSPVVPGAPLWERVLLLSPFKNLLKQTG